MIILSLDIATGTGWGAYNTDRHHASIECGVLDLSVDNAKSLTGMEKRRLMRGKIDAELCGLIDKYRPDVACIEQPLNYIKPSGGAPRGKKAPLFKGDTLPDVATSNEKGGPNADTVLMLNQLFAVADTVCRHKCKLVVEVAPKTWQTITSRFPGDTKQRSIALCSLLKIVIPSSITTKPARGDAADAAAIAYWCAGHCQALKLLKMERAA